ncbi:hypothetical protein K2173_016585 [Erythroxylum novogranatense]|uniref:Uncharacterized protein n=1 Tax=Erythroxylum novogranatense TaxID=1862640 RepID=A0AAV8SST7_9ROSI|nr:hypothetical protein K2173_016585 [Erythroxylum novogranatense]
MCGDVLGNLMKHEYGWVFNVPVDAKKLKLHDYHKIIKRPMDLGTVKRKLNENLYKSPTEFAEDVRLTFKNAITYNEKGQDVHFMAQVLLKIFEERWAVIKTKFKFDRRPQARNSANSPTKDIPNSCSSAPIHAQSTIAVPPVQVPSEKRKLDRLEASAVSLHSKSSTGNTDTILKKPKAASAERRDMTYEEKHRLSIDLQNLASDKLDSVVQIIRRRNPGLFRQEDEIEVDIESFDAETLWELNSFVTKYKDSLSKNQKNGEYALKGACTNVKETSMISAAGEVFTGPEAGTVEGENASGSSHSGSSSSDTGSSSSGSDSDSSSGCGSDGGQ